MRRVPLGNLQVPVGNCPRSHGRHGCCRQWNASIKGHIPECTVLELSLAQNGHSLCIQNVRDLLHRNDWQKLLDLRPRVLISHVIDKLGPHVELAELILLLMNTFNWRGATRTLLEGQSIPIRFLGVYKSTPGGSDKYPHRASLMTLLKHLMAFLSDR